MSDEDFLKRWSRRKRDVAKAKQLGVKPSGNGRRQAYNHPPMPRMTNTYLKPGKYSAEEILKTVKDGVYAKGFTGGQVDITKGDFTFSCSECYKIEDGKITEYRVALKVTFILKD